MSGLLDQNTAYVLKSANVDQIILDLIGSAKTIRSVYGIEKTPEDQAVRHSEGPYMFNTKFETPYMKAKNKAFQFDQWEKRGYDRLGTFKRLMESEPRPYSINTMERIMSDHSPSGPIWDWSTLMGYIMLPQSLKIRIYPGPPDYAAYEESTL